jgi:hypothetical protein
MSDRVIWMRLLCGSVRGTTYWYAATRGDVVPGWVSTSTPAGATADWIPIVGDVTIPGATVDPLSGAAAGTTLGVRVLATAGARSVFGPDVLTAPAARRWGGLMRYLSRTATSATVLSSEAIANDDYLTIDGEIVRVSDAAGYTPGDLSTIVLERGVLGTSARPHAVPLGSIGAPLLRLESTPATGQWVEVGVTEAGSDVVLYRGRVDSVQATADQTLTIQIRSLLSVLRDFVPQAPRALQDSAVVAVEYERAILSSLFVQWDLFEGEWPGLAWTNAFQVTHVRVIGEGGDWAVLSLELDFPFVDARIIEAEPSPLPPVVQVVVREARTDWDGELPIPSRYVWQVGSGDGLIRFTGEGQVRFRELGGGRTGTRTFDLRGQLVLEFVEGLADGVAEVEWVRAIEPGLSPWRIATYWLTGRDADYDDLPAGMSPWLPPGWVDTGGSQVGVPVPGDEGVPYALMGTDAPLVEFLADTLFGPAAMAIVEDRGQLLPLEWSDPVRPLAGVALTETSGDDRTTGWVWGTSRTEPFAGVELQDPTTDVYVLRSLGTRNAARLSTAARGGRQARRESSRVERLLSDATWLSAPQSLLPVTMPRGISDAVREVWRDTLDLYAQSLPVLQHEVADDLAQLVGRQMLVELDELPSGEPTAGWVLSAERRLGTGTVRVSLLLPYVGRPALTVWGPWGVVDSVGTGTLDYEAAEAGPGQTLQDIYGGIFAPSTLRVLRPDLSERGTLGGTLAVGSGTVTWTTLVGDPPEEDDLLVLPVRPGVVPSLTPAGASYGYVAGATVEPGDGTWQ